MYCVRKIMQTANRYVRGTAHAEILLAHPQQYMGPIKYSDNITRYAFGDLKCFLVAANVGTYIKFKNVRFNINIMSKVELMIFVAPCRRQDPNDLLCIYQMDNRDFIIHNYLYILYYDKAGTCGFRKYV